MVHCAGQVRYGAVLEHCFTVIFGHLYLITFPLFFFFNCLAGRAATRGYRIVLFSVQIVLRTTAEQSREDDLWLSRKHGPESIWPCVLVK